MLNNFYGLSCFFLRCSFLFEAFCFGLFLCGGGGGSVDTGGDLCGTICCSSSIQHETNIDTICGKVFGLATCKWACQRLRCRFSQVGGSNAVHRERG